MKILIVGAGALGGYFGGRMLQAGLDVTFLVRERRAAQLAKTGLVITSPKGDATIANPPTVRKDALGGPYDLILVGCKAYDLASTMDDFAAAVGSTTAILPILNGMRHFEILAARFGDAAVLGGLSIISAALDAEGIVKHFNDTHVIMFGERAGGRSARVDALAEAWSHCNFTSRALDDITQAIWEKWCAITSIAGSTCLLRAPIGDIVAADAHFIGLQIFEECCEVAAAHGHRPVGEQRDRAIAVLTQAGSPITASMAKDIDRGAATEGDHILGHMLALARDKGIDAPTLAVAAAHLATYERRRAREQSKA